MNAYDRLIMMCEECSIDYKQFIHEPLYTIEDAVRESGGGIDENIKTILVKGKNEFYIFVTLGSSKVPFKKLKKIIGKKSLTFASEEEFKDVLGYSFGATTPLGNDESIPIFIDKDVRNLSSVYINPGKNEETFMFSKDDFFLLLGKYHQYQVI